MLGFSPCANVEYWWWPTARIHSERYETGARLARGQTLRRAASTRSRPLQPVREGSCLPIGRIGRKRCVVLGITALSEGKATRWRQRAHGHTPWLNWGSTTELRTSNAH